MDEHLAVVAIIQARNEAPLVFDPERTALLVIDVQRYFVHPGYPFGELFERLSPGVTAGYFQRVHEMVLPSIQYLLSGARARRMPVFFTATGTQMGDGCDLPGWLRELDELGIAVLGSRVWPAVEDPSWQVDDAVGPRAGEPVLVKASSGPLASTRLDQTLRHLGVDTVIVTGLTTDVCVTQAARELADRGFSAIVVEDACTTLSEEMHRGALQAFNIAFGRVKTAREVMDLMAPGAAGARVGTPSAAHG